MKVYRRCGLCVCALFLIPLAGCSDSTTSGGSGGSAGSGGARGPGGTGGAVGFCTNAEDTAVFDTLEYTNDDGEMSTGVDGAIAMAGDCPFGQPPRCGPELAAVIIDNSEENNAALGECELACMSMQTDLSQDCLSCFGGVVVCAAANCIVECARGAFLPECQTCRIENDCDSDFGECSGVQATPSFQMLTVTVTDPESFETLFDGPPLEGVEVCETDTDSCATTDAEGHASIELMANQETSYTLTKDGYLPYLVPVLPTATMTSTWPMLSDALGQQFADIMMTAYPWEGGSISVAAFTLRAGVTHDLVGETAAEYYSDEDGVPVPVPTLTETTSFGRGGFVEVAAGEYEVEFGGTAIDCVRSFGWPSDAPNTIRLPVRDGYLTYGSMNGCSEP
jgi:hypothetical protein